MLSTDQKNRMWRISERIRGIESSWSYVGNEEKRAELQALRQQFDALYLMANSGGTATLVKQFDVKEDGHRVSDSLYRLNPAWEAGSTYLSHRWQGPFEFVRVMSRLAVGDECERTVVIPCAVDGSIRGFQHYGSRNLNHADALKTFGNYVVMDTVGINPKGAHYAGVNRGEFTQLRMRLIHEEDANIWRGIIMGYVSFQPGWQGVAFATEDAGLHNDRAEWLSKLDTPLPSLRPGSTMTYFPMQARVLDGMFCVQVPGAPGYNREYGMGFEMKMTPQLQAFLDHTEGV